MTATAQSMRANDESDGLCGTSGCQLLTFIQQIKKLWCIMVGDCHPTTRLHILAHVQYVLSI